MVLMGKLEIPQDADDWSGDEDDVVFIPGTPGAPVDLNEEPVGFGFVNVALADVEVEAAAPAPPSLDIPEPSSPAVPAPSSPPVVSSLPPAEVETPVAAGSVSVPPPSSSAPAQQSPRKRHTSGKYRKVPEEDEGEEKKNRCGRRRTRRLERDHEAERLLARLLNKHHLEPENALECPFVNVSAFTRLFQNTDHMRLWLSFAGASEEDQERFLRWGERPDRNRADDRSKSRRRGEDPHKCRPSVSPRKAFDMIAKKLRRQLVRGHIRLSELAVIEEDVVLSFFARYPRGGEDVRRASLSIPRSRRGGGDDDEFLYGILAGLPTGELEDNRFVEAAEAEGRQVVAVPIAKTARPAVQSIAQYYGLTCNFLRCVAGTLYAILKNNFDDFPMPLRCLHEVAAEIKESYLVC